MRRIMKRIGTALWVVLALIGGGVVALAAIAQFEPRPDGPDSLLMKFIDFRPLYDSKKVLVVDVRNADIFAAGHIAGAMHVALSEISTRTEAVRTAAKGRLVVTYCSCPSEGTSLAAAGRLMSAGVKAKALVGGYPRWVEFGGAVERSK